jgi:hypothetical protein
MAPLPVPYPSPKNSSLRLNFIDPPSRGIIRLTYQETEHKESGDRPSPSEIEITPTMLAAGVDVLAGYDKRLSMDDEIVAAIYCAMAAKS